MGWKDIHWKRKPVRTQSLDLRILLRSRSKNQVPCSSHHESFGETSITEASITEALSITETETLNPPAPVELSPRQRLTKLPPMSSFSNPLILVNRERMQRDIEPLTRCRELDAMAKQHAMEMAEAQALKEPYRDEKLVENVNCGPSIKLMHQISMFGVSVQERNNMLDARFSKFGMATAKGKDGMMYMSQLFQELTK